MIRLGGLGFLPRTDRACEVWFRGGILNHWLFRNCLKIEN